MSAGLVLWAAVALVLVLIAAVNADRKSVV